ncbi:Scarecrow-like protein 9 [Zea mays]|uniref:Scarecrow-like protein 9 n=1 Tax=Zea mays TaxID=4577 RepID=A0A3L6EZP5_MAIZE|nr:Scarecrow-like protein 9 [Zea mays]
MRPEVFVLYVDNSSHNAPFFATRFREALFYYSALFDMMDATTPRDSDDRVLVERELLGRCALNVITCEGSERVERPETYRQWQVRCSRAGLRQLPLDPSTVKCLSDLVKEGYHKDFVIDVDQQWLLQGWKGHPTMYIMSFLAHPTMLRVVSCLDQAKITMPHSSSFILVRSIGVRPKSSFRRSHEH